MEPVQEDDFTLIVEPPAARQPRITRQIIKNYELTINVDPLKLNIYFAVNRTYMENLIERKQRPNVAPQIKSHIGKNCIIYKQFTICAKDAKILYGEQHIIKGNIHILHNQMTNIEIRIYFNRDIKLPSDNMWINLHHLSGGVWKSKCYTLMQEGKKFLHKIPIDEVNEYLQPNLLINFTLKKKELSNTANLGIINLGNTCFMNSCLQMLFYIRPLRKIVLETNSRNKLIRALRQVFISLLDFGQKKPIDVELLLDSYPKYNEIPRRQHDVQEFLLDFINEIEAQCPEVKSLWQGKCSQTTYSKQATKPYKSTQVESFAQLDVRLQDSDQKYYQKIEESLKESINEQEVDQMIENDEFGKIKVSKYRTFQTLPDVLFVNLKRYEWNKEKMRLSKIFSHIEYADNLNLGFIVGTPGNQQINPDCDYTLFTVIVHKGTSPHNGHYFVFVNTSQKWQHPEWVCFNDSIVTRSDVEEVLGFTGKKKKQIILDKTNARFVEKQIQSDASSYLLVYMRKAIFDQYQSISTPIPRDYIKQKIKKAADKEKQNLQQINVLAIDNLHKKINLFDKDLDLIQVPVAKNESLRSELKKVSKSLLGIQAKYIYRVYVDERKVKYVYGYQTAIDVSKYHRGYINPTYILILPENINVISQRSSNAELGLLKINKNQCQQIKVSFDIGLISSEDFVQMEKQVKYQNGRLNYIDSRDDFVEGWNLFIELEERKDFNAVDPYVEESSYPTELFIFFIFLIYYRQCYLRIWQNFIQQTFFVQFLLTWKLVLIQFINKKTMGQGCFKSGQVSQVPKKQLKCQNCHNPIQDTHNHRCYILTKLENNRPTLVKSNIHLRINPSTLVKFYGAGVFQPHGDMFNLKVFTTSEQTQTTWIKQPTWFFPTKMRERYPQMMKNRSFQEKLYWFRLNVQRIRISWQSGAQKIKVDRSNIIMSSKQQLEKINLRKQLKIIFTDETVDDAGGLLREYMHLALKQIFGPQMGIFQMAESRETAYRFRWDETLVDELVIETMKVLGMIIGKALFERISINCYLDRTILRQILGQPIHFEDVYTYDQNIYNSMKSILNEMGASQIQLNFCVYHQTPGQKSATKIQLIPDGQNIIVKDTNKQEYAKLLIHQYCTLSCLKYLHVLRQHVYKVVPFSLLSIFQPIQLEMMLYGPTNIDVHDWKNNTEYKGYKPNDKQIQWFWQFVEKQNQEKLRHLLHYVTGTTRVPILGFRYLQSNRNQLMRFTIQRLEYDRKNPYPKSYTCFNRLHLPAYSTKEQLFEKMKQITENELSHFGLE